MSNTFEADQLIRKYLNKLQQNKRLRTVLAALIVVALLGLMAKFAYDMMPRQYTLTITGGDILSQRHMIAKVLEEEAAKQGIALVIRPVSGSVQALEQVNSGKLDLAFIQGGLNLRLEHVVHVSTLSTETLHLLVKPDIKDIHGLRGKVVNMGSKSGGTRVVANKVMKFIGLQENVDYAETNQSVEEVLTLHARKLPDAMFVVSTAPSYVVDSMVKKNGYRLLEIPFPEALSLREGWVNGEKVLAYTYNSNPPEPARDLKSLGVNMHLVANDKVDTRAISKLLEVLYSPQVASKLRMRFDESRVTIPSGFALSPATEKFLQRNETFFSAKAIENIQKGFGLAMTLLTLCLMMVKWFSGSGLDDNGSFKAYIKQVGEIEDEVARLRQQPKFDAVRLQELMEKLTQIRTEAMRRYPTAKLTDATIMDKVIHSTAGARAHIAALLVSRQT